MRKATCYRTLWYVPVKYVRWMTSLIICDKTWLDERLFGWSRSAETSREVSRAGSPRGSDDEDAGDYDRLLKASQHEGTTGEVQNRRGSYADLQKLRAVGMSH
jgi:glycerol-3-phosphate O-acyltransferase/dihydroxyacetone phosphate acyltransferase